MYLLKGELNTAIENYNRAIELKSDSGAAYSVRGIAYHRKGEIDSAIKDYTQAINLKHNYAVVYNRRGTAYLKKGERTQAIQDYTKAIELEPNDAESHNKRGIAWLHMQEWENFKSGLTVARNAGVDMAAGFRNVFGSIANFEQKTGIQLPEDIAALLTPP